MTPNLGKLYVVATPIGNLGDFSERAKEVLSQVTWVAAEDTRHSQVLFAHLGIAPSLISYHDHNAHERTSHLISKLQQGESGALISDAGTPLISDPGFLLVSKAHEAGITVIPIPGACALIAALSVSGLPTDKFLFEGFLPAKSHARQQHLLKLKEFAHTLIFYEAPHRLFDLMTDLVSVLGVNRQVFVAREITKKFESFYLDTTQKILEDLQNNQIPLKGEFVVIVQGAKEQTNLSEQEQEAKHLLDVLLAEVPLKQAVKIASKLTKLNKNALYDFAISLRNNEN